MESAGVFLPAQIVMIPPVMGGMGPHGVDLAACYDLVTLRVNPVMLETVLTAVGRSGCRRRRTDGPSAAVGIAAVGPGQPGPSRSRSVRRTSGPSPATSRALLSMPKTVTVAAQIAVAEASERAAGGPAVGGPGDHPAGAVAPCRGRRAGAAARGRTTPRRPTRHQPASPPASACLTHRLSS
jgi:hypothetical protein